MARHTYRDLIIWLPLQLGNQTKYGTTTKKWLKLWRFCYHHHGCAHIPIISWQLNSLERRARTGRESANCESKVVNIAYLRDFKFNIPLGRHFRKIKVRV